jgi:multidrug efflux system outer membrane protein
VATTPQIAAWRVDEAGAQAGIARSEFFPQIGYQAQFTPASARSALAVGVETPALPPVNFHTVNVNATWEIDLWGRIRRLNEAARAQFLGAEDNGAASCCRWSPRSPRPYCELRELDAELDIARRNVKTFGETLDLFQRRRQAGVASGLETAARRGRARAGGCAGAAPRSSGGGQGEPALVLLGRNPGPIQRGASLDEFPIPPDVPPGLPSRCWSAAPTFKRPSRH